MRILRLTSLALIGLAGAAYAADKIPDPAPTGPSEWIGSPPQLDAKAEKPGYDREQTKELDGEGVSPNSKREAFTSQNVDRNNGSDRRQLADNERRNGPSVGDRAKDDDSHDHDRDQAEREKQEDDSD
jgi:hypothetical protein